jgi:two-component system, CAI-1 autoinducer sensor kinase/phosphatase CqsS
MTKVTIFARTFRAMNGYLLAAQNLWRDLLRLLASTLAQPLEPILHRSVVRIRFAGGLYIAGNFIFLWVWGSWLQQPYESLALRVANAILGLVMLLLVNEKNLESRITEFIYSAVVWVEFPLFFSWMLLCNHANDVWLATCVGIIILYYQMTDWRLASTGLLLGLGVAIGLSVVLPALGLMKAMSYQLPSEAWVILFCAWFVGLVQGLSSAKLRTVQLKNTVSAMGILAHELRTPIASVALMGEVLRDSADQVGALTQGAEVAGKLSFLSNRLDVLVRMMTTHIDAQIANARQNLPRVAFDPLKASDCVQLVLANYPFINQAARSSVRLTVQQDFCFLGVNEWVAQMLNNLIKNALYALAQKPKPFGVGDLSIVVCRVADRGIIEVIDKGVGLAKNHHAQIFKPFYSTNRASSHGLGLTYCRKVAEAFGGTIQFQSELGIGSMVTLNLPIHGA